jgi:RNA polymerase sigma-70 factor (ECF subfamily)
MRVWASVPEDELLAGVLAREAGAWAGFHTRYQRLIIACIKKALHRYSAHYTEEDVEDLVSMVCLNLVKDDYKKLRTFDGGRGYKLSSWVGLIATNTTLDGLRRRDPAHQPMDGEDGEKVVAQVADSRGDPGEAMQRRQEWQALLVAIGGLSPTDREFLELYYDDEAEPEVIAKRMGISVNTVYSRKNKLREKLRKLIEDSGPGKVGAHPA